MPDLLKIIKSAGQVSIYTFLSLFKSSWSLSKSPGLTKGNERDYPSVLDCMS